MLEQEKPKDSELFNSGAMKAALDKLPPEIRRRIEVPLRSANPKVFLTTLKNLRDQLDTAITKLEEVVGDDTSTDTGKRG